MKLTKVEIRKYKSIENTQEFDVDNNITVLVGMNESGKTSILESIAKCNYFKSDEKFIFNKTFDYPRKEKKKLDKSGENPEAVKLTYRIENSNIEKIESLFYKKILNTNEFYIISKYDNSRLVNFPEIEKKSFIVNFFKGKPLEESMLESLVTANSLEAFDECTVGHEEESWLQEIRKFYENKNNWGNCFSEYVYTTFIKDKVPKFLYYDEYYTLPSQIVVEDVYDEKQRAGYLLSEDERKTAQALFDLADINEEEIISSESFEDFIAELEATQSLITNELFEFWSANKNLNIRFAIESKMDEIRDGRGTLTGHNKFHVLNIRVENTRSGMTLPLKNRSKGFNWFFSFLVWFKSIQEDSESNYILLLDEPGLNLHATAQTDLLRFFTHLSNNYQVIYTTHSPFMIDNLKLSSVRTVVETESGTKISNSIQEKDPKTLFPLQAALGYDIAQNLFIGRNNLLVEGVSDLIYLNIISSILTQRGKKGLREDIVITPVGGLDKVTTFISLIGASKLNICCLLDSFTDTKGKEKLQDLIRGNIIKEKNILFYHDFIGNTQGDIEDVFNEDEYIRMFNSSFVGEYELNVDNIKQGPPQIVQRIAKAIGKPRFNHTRPARQMASNIELQSFSIETIQRFEKIFESVNAMF